MTMVKKMKNRNIARIIRGTGFFIMGFIFRDFVGNGPPSPPPMPPMCPIPEVCPVPETCPVLAICPAQQECKWDAFFEKYSSVEGHLSCIDHVKKYGCPWYEPFGNKQDETFCIEYIRNNGCPWVGYLSLVKPWVVDHAFV